MFEGFETVLRAKSQAGGDAVEFGVGLSNSERGFGDIDGEDFLRVAVFQAVQREAAVIGEDVEDAVAGGEAGDEPPVVALVEIEAGLLAFDEIDAIPHVVLGEEERPRRRFAPQQAVLLLESFGGANPFLGPQPDAARLEFFAEQFEQRLLPLREGETRELHDQPVSVAVDRESRELVAFAVDQPAGEFGAPLRE